MTDTEAKRLENIANQSLYAAGINQNSIEYSFRVFQRYISGETVLEMGPAEGVMTGLLCGLGRKLTVVEGSALFCDRLRERHPDITVIHSLFEAYRPEERYDNIVLGHVLEHVEDPVAILRMVRSWLAPNGRVLAAVPNSRSMHRQAAVIMGMLAFEEDLNDTDRHHGHRRVYNPETFRRDFREAGFRVEVFGGYWLKPLSNRQIESGWSPEMINAFFELGERYPDIAGEIYVVAR